MTDDPMTMPAGAARENSKQLRPIRVFYSLLSHRFYATSAYKIDDKGLATVTGHKFDVTNDIAGLIERHAITFSKRAKTEDNTR